MAAPITYVTMLHVLVPVQAATRVSLTFDVEYPLITLMFTISWGLVQLATGLGNPLLLRLNMFESVLNIYRRAVLLK
jgi:hypothetical protein